MKASDIPDAVALRACDWIGQDKEPPWRQMVAMGFPEKVVYAKMDKFAKRGWIEVGVSTRTGWITRKGREALKALEGSNG